MKITIITIAYNSAEGIGRTIESVLAQEPGDIPYTMEYLVIDGASSDDTVAIAQSYIPDMESRGIDYRISSEPDGGIYDAMNKGIRRATGDIIGIGTNPSRHGRRRTLLPTQAAILCTPIYVCIRGTAPLL